MWTEKVGVKQSAWAALCVRPTEVTIDELVQQDLDGTSNARERLNADKPSLSTNAMILWPGVVELVGQAGERALSRREILKA